MENRYLSAQKMAQFDNEGYMKIDAFIPINLLEKLRNFFEEEMSNTEVSNEKAIIENKGKSYVVNLDNICNRKNPSCLELLGFPPVLQIANQICGNDYFLIQEFSVIKNLGDELPVLWHLDMLHERKGKCFTMGFYLDDADENDGALKVIPKSHLSNESICEISKAPSVEVPMKAGDVLIHDMMLAHSSTPLQKNNMRRVIYFEFLSAAHVRAENIYTAELVSRRTRLLFAASKHYKSSNPSFLQFQLEKEDVFKDEQKEINEILAEVYSGPINARPSTYCFENLQP